MPRRAWRVFWEVMLPSRAMMPSSTPTERVARTCGSPASSDVLAESSNAYLLADRRRAFGRLHRVRELERLGEPATQVLELTNAAARRAAGVTVAAGSWLTAADGARR